MPVQSTTHLIPDINKRVCEKMTLPIVKMPLHACPVARLPQSSEYINFNNTEVVKKGKEVSNGSNEPAI